MRKCKIDKALDQLNAAKGVAYPDIGHSRYENVKGDGRNFRTVYTIINAGGGVTFSTLNGATPRQTLFNIESAIRAVEGTWR